jgi:hypothetical protein
MGPLSGSRPSRQTHFLCGTRSAIAFNLVIGGAAGIEPASVSPLLSALHA